MATKARAGIEGHEAKGFCSGAIDDFEDVEVQRRQSCLSLLTSAIFTQRKIFSSNLTISAARVELTGITFETISRKVRRQRVRWQD